MPTTEQRLANLAAASADLDPAEELLVALKRAAQDGIESVRAARNAAAQTLSNPTPEPGENATMGIASALQSIATAIAAIEAAQTSDPGQRLAAVLAGIPQPEPEEDE